MAVKPNRLSIRVETVRELSGVAGGALTGTTTYTLITCPCIPESYQSGCGPDLLSQHGCA
ncbi:MAG TPA: hypothetical protein VG245_03700 [Candidatus Dormibacteraeota bacterium]|jgi:hypothetical protein|nr:hypothetical protein [Candidatus Dormibacteraeota bacterium]